MYSLFGDDDPDSINVLSSKSNILYNMGQYQEAYDIGLKNLERYAKFSGELNYLRFEQLITVYKCCLIVGSSEEKERMKNNVLSIAEQLLSKESKQYQELLKLAE